MLPLHLLLLVEGLLIWPLLLLLLMDWRLVGGRLLLVAVAVVGRLVAVVFPLGFRRVQAAVLGAVGQRVRRLLQSSPAPFPPCSRWCPIWPGKSGSVCGETFPQVLPGGRHRDRRPTLVSFFLEFVLGGRPLHGDQPP
jgi:hypothetical protein